MHRLYDDLADLYPLMSEARQYEGDAKLILRALRRTLGPPPRRGYRLLELGVGAGHVLSHLTPHCRAVAVDLSPKMVALSEKLNPAVPHFTGDMRSVRLEKPHTKFDAVLIHDAIHYMLDENDLLAAMTTAAAHLRKGGVGLFMPGYVRETYIDGDVSHLLSIHAEPDLGYIAQTRDEYPGDTQYHFNILLLTRKAGRILVEEDRHTCGLFPLVTWMRLLADAGFDARRPRLVIPRTGPPPPQVPLFIGRRR